jgi:hypothetical protein
MLAIQLPVFREFAGGSHHNPLGRLDSCQSKRNWGFEKKRQERFTCPLEKAKTDNRSCPPSPSKLKYKSENCKPLRHLLILNCLVRCVCNVANLMTLLSDLYLLSIIIAFLVLVVVVAVELPWPSPPNRERPPAFTVDTKAPQTGIAVIFKVNSGVRFSTLNWLFGDGKSDSRSEHIYDYPGEYCVRLVLTNKNGISSTFNEKIKVRAASVSAKFEPETSSGLQCAFFDNSTMTVKPIGRRLWNFGNGKAAQDTDSQVLHSFEEPSSYKIRLSVTAVDDSTSVCDRFIRVVRLPDGAAPAPVKPDKVSG